MESLVNKFGKVAILGIGTEGLALVDFLADKSESISILDKLSAAEIRTRLEGEELLQFEKINSDLKVNKIFGPEYLDNLKDFDIVFRSPGVKYFDLKIQEAIEAGIEVSSQIKLFFELCPCQIIGVTGTKGKGTTSSLIHQILKENYKEDKNVFLAGNIGYPIITLLDQIKRDDIVVLELSNFQLVDLDKSPHIAVVTNLSEDHLDYHKDIEEYHNAKFNIVKYQTKEDFAVLNKVSTFPAEKIDQLESVKKYFAKDQTGADAYIESDTVILRNDDEAVKICSKGEIKLYGSHNLENIAAASLVSSILNIDPKIIAKTAKQFSGLPHRIELVGEIDGARYINDSYATNPEPTMAAINSFSEPKILILGGSSKGSDFNLLAKKVVDSDVKAVVLINPEGVRIKELLLAHHYSGKIIEGGKNIQEVIKLAKDEASPGDVILLSPACASFGMFKNYKDRGNKFRDYVKKLENESNQKS